MWKTIDTAPRDGTLVDLWADGKRETDCYFLSGDWWTSRRGSMEELWGHVTHWMPLPKSPFNDTP